MAVIDNKPIVWKDKTGWHHKDRWVVTKESKAHWINGSTSELNHTREITYDEAVRRYHVGDYTMRVPPVSTHLWDDHSWITWIFPNIKKNI